ncbi:uncharacterized protein V1516DRAFT_634761 [Lipomyces oligophaga]|uniref:uncharacterized protein n=1 Tax=Lipomyces oligophaga TaxID=45792 RepID=UPI0034CF95B3
MNRSRRDEPPKRRIAKLNEQELEQGVSEAGSWHNDYKDTAFIFIGSLSFNLTEGDVLAIFSQYGNPVFLHLMRDKETGKSKGFAFLKYEDQRSTILAVDNLDGATVLGRQLRVDHTFYKMKGDENDLELAMSFDKEPDLEFPRSNEPLLRQDHLNQNPDRSRNSHSNRHRELSDGKDWTDRHRDRRHRNHDDDRSHRVRPKEQSRRYNPEVRVSKREK